MPYSPPAVDHKNSALTIKTTRCLRIGIWMNVIVTAAIVTVVLADRRLLLSIQTSTFFVRISDVILVAAIFLRVIAVVMNGLFAIHSRSSLGAACHILLFESGFGILQMICLAPGYM